MSEFSAPNSSGVQNSKGEMRHLVATSSLNARSSRLPEEVTTFVVRVGKSSSLALRVYSLPCARASADIDSSNSAVRIFKNFLMLSKLRIYRYICTLCQTI